MKNSKTDLTIEIEKETQNLPIEYQERILEQVKAMVFIKQGKEKPPDKTA